MPPTFLYLLALLLYFVAACVVWFVAAALAIRPRTRTLAKKIAAGMAGSFPGVFIFQLLVAPLIALVLLAVACIPHSFQPPDILIAVLAPVIVLSIISIPAIASLLGFYAGWRVAWELAAGRSARGFLATDRILGPVVRFLRRWVPFLERFL